MPWPGNYGRLIIAKNMSETINRRDLDFLIYEMLDAESPAEVVDGKVRMVPEAGKAAGIMFEAGFVAAGMDSEHGGLQLPFTVASACMAIFQSANIGLSGLPLLTAGVANLLIEYGNEEQKALYLPPLLDGRFYGTMWCRATGLTQTAVRVSITTSPWPG